MPLPSPTKYQPISKRRDREDWVKDREDNLDNPALVADLKDPTRYRNELKREKQALEDSTPPDITSDKEWNELSKRERFLARVMRNGDPALGLDPMNSHRAMQENPAFARGRELMWQKWTKNLTVDNDGKVRRADPNKGERGVVFEWKDLARTLGKEREQDDPDVANIERIRPLEDKGESKFIHYRRATFAPGSHLTTVQYNEATGHEATDVERAVEAAEAAGVAQTPSPERLYAPAEAPAQCQAVTAKGKQCSRMAVGGTSFCGIPAHSGK